MKSEEISLIANEPFIRKFVYAIIQNIRSKNFEYKDRQVIHSDLVPKVSEKVMQASLGQKITPEVKTRSTTAPIFVAQRKIIPRPSSASIMRPRPVSQPRIIPRQIPIQPPVQPMAQAPGAPQGATLSQDYGKITPLLNDPSVSTIECQGAGKPLMIIRAGQKQGTRITLNAKEIKEVLQKVSDVVHIPLLEGVFRAAVDNFSINAVISEMIGSRFVIKKQTAYSMLER